MMWYYQVSILSFFHLKNIGTPPPPIEWKTEWPFYYVYSMILEKKLYAWILLFANSDKLALTVELPYIPMHILV